jgi:hypothetical protein
MKSILLLFLFIQFGIINPINKKIEKKIKTIETEFSFKLIKVFQYKGTDISESKYLSNCRNLGIVTNDIKSIVCYRYNKPEFNFIPITIEFWLFENEKKAKSFLGYVTNESQSDKFIMLKVERLFFLKRNLIIYVSGNPKQQELMRSISKILNEF